MIDLCKKEDACLRAKRSMHKLLDYEMLITILKGLLFTHGTAQTASVCRFVFVISVCSLVDTRPISLFQTLGQCVARRKGA